jgi:prophage regulatory protein
MSRFLRRRAVEHRTGLSRSTIYMMMHSGTFPRPVRIGGRAVAWLESDIDAWIEARLQERVGGCA